MHGNGTRTWICFLLALIVGFSAAVQPAAAEEAHYYSGEPTDPEEILFLLESSDVDLKDHGLTQPKLNNGNGEDDEDIEDWLEAVLDLLRSLGILAPEDDEG